MVGRVAQRLERYSYKVDVDSSILSTPTLESVNEYPNLRILTSAEMNTSSARS